MASIALGVVGAAVGSFFGNPMLGWSIGTTVGSLFDTLSQPGNNTSIGQLTDLVVSSSSYGTTIPFVWGGSRQPGIIIWSTSLEQHSQTQSQGGGSGGGGASTTTYSYSVSCAVAYAQGVLMMADGSFVKRNVYVKKIFADDMVIYDSSVPSSDNLINPTFYDGDEGQGQDPTIASAISNTPAYRGVAYFVIENMDLTTNWSNRIPNWQVELDTDPVTVGDILSDWAGMVGLVNGVDFDFSDATDLVTGYYIDSTETVQDSIDPLCQIYAYDISEYDGIIHAIKRGSSTIDMTINAADLGARVVADDGKANEDELTTIQIKRAQDTELPARLELAYYADGRDYEANVQTAIRQNTETYNDNQLSTRFSFTDVEAANFAGQLIDTAWIERMSYQVTLPWSYIQLVPASLVWLPVNGIPVRCRITDISVKLIGELTFGMVADDPDVIVQDATAGGATGAPAVSSATTVPTTFDVISETELRDQDQLKPGYYVAAHGLAGSSQWRGGMVYQLLAATGATWTQVSSVGGQSVFGASTTALADGVTSGAWDTMHTVTVSVVDGFTLGSTTEANVAQGVNVAFLGDEIIGFTTATLVSAGVYTLSGIMRGIRNSPMTGHTTTDIFILADSTLARVQVPSTAIGTVVQVKVLSPGQILTDVTAKSVTIATPTVTATQSQINTINSTLSGLTLQSSLTDVDASDMTVGYVLTRKAGGGFDMEAAGSGGFSVDDIMTENGNVLVDGMTGNVLVNG